MRRPDLPFVLVLCALMAPARGQNTTSQDAQSGTSSGTALPTSQPSLISGTVDIPTATYTSILTVPSYSFASTMASSALASLEPLIPSYLYNLTMETNMTREAICNQQTSYCSIAGCVSPGANVSTNFCNVNTMGWNCACSTGASRLYNWQAPVQIFDCRLRNQACQEACQNPTATPAVTNLAGCTEACTDLIGNTCGQANQINVNYMVAAASDTPSYAGNTMQGGEASRSAAAVIGAATFLSALAGVSFVFLNALS